MNAAEFDLISNLLFTIIIVLIFTLFVAPEVDKFATMKAIEARAMCGNENFYYFPCEDKL